MSARLQCPNCLETFEAHEITDGSCRSCGAAVNRHPDSSTGDSGRDERHEFQPVKGHPDDDECTFTGGNPDWYCGLPEEAHPALMDHPPAAPPSPPERADGRPATDADQLREAADWLDTYDAMARFFGLIERSEGSMPEGQRQRAKGLIPAASSDEVQADLRRIADDLNALLAAPVQPRGDELGVLREAVERFYRVDGYPAAMQVVRAAESLLAASPATADRTDGPESVPVDEQRPAPDRGDEVQIAGSIGNIVRVNDREGTCVIAWWMPTGGPGFGEETTHDMPLAGLHVRQQATTSRPPSPPADAQPSHPAPDGAVGWSPIDGMTPGWGQEADPCYLGGSRCASCPTCPHNPLYSEAERDAAIAARTTPPAPPLGGLS